MISTIKTVTINPTYETTTDGQYRAIFNFYWNDEKFLTTRNDCEEHLTEKLSDIEKRLDITLDTDHAPLENNGFAILAPDEGALKIAVGILTSTLSTLDLRAA